MEAAELEASLIRFLAAAWPEIDPAPFIPNWHFDAVCEHLEAVMKGQIRKLLINEPPRHGKSLTVSVAFPSWVWAQAGPTERLERGLPLVSPIAGTQASFLCLSYSGDLAFDHALLMKRLILSDWYQKRWGRRVQIRDDKTATGKFDTTAGGTRISSSFGGTVTGRGGDYKIIDDPHKVKEAESELIREQAIKDYDQTLKNRVTDPRHSVEIIVMQRTHEKDLAGHVLTEDPDFVHLMLPAEFEPDRHCMTYVDGQPFWADQRKEKGELLWPEVWGAQQLKPFKREQYSWCTPGESPVLMADLSLKPIARMQVGDRIIGFTTQTEPSAKHADAYSRRRLTHTEVLSISKSVQSVVKVTLDSGEAIRCTADHNWYSANRGDKPLYWVAKVGRKLMRVCPPRLRQLTTEDEIRAAGWLAGFFDGEGSAVRTKKQDAYPPSICVTFTQGADRNLFLCERLEQELTRFGFDFGYQTRIRHDRKKRDGAVPLSRWYYLINNGRRVETLQRFLHVIQPSKWRDRMIDGALGTAFITDKERVVSIEPDGEETVYGLETTTGNYVVWGLASSNSGQYQQRPAPAGGGIIKRDWWQLWGDEADPELVKPENARFRKHPPYSFKVATLDTAYTGKQQNDPCGMHVWGVFSDTRGFPQAMLANAWNERLEFPELMRRVIQTARKFKIDVLLVEDKTAGPPLVQELQRKYRNEQWSVELVPVNRSSGDKMVRLQSVSFLFQQNMIWAPNKVWAEDAISEITMFPKGAHDEHVDCASMALRWLRARGLLETEDEIRDVEEEKRRRPERMRPLYPGAA